MSISRIALVAGLILVGAARANAQTVPVKEEAPGMLKEAKVPPVTAQKVALAQVPGGTVVSAEIEREDGRLQYEYGITVSGRPEHHEIEIDAMTGAVVDHDVKSPDRNRNRHHNRR